jgi:hypothetical protein
MKALLEFDLNDPDDRMDHLRCIKSLSMACVLFELTYNTFKTAYDYQEVNKDADMVEYLKQRLIALLDEHNVNVDELIS